MRAEREAGCLERTEKEMEADRGQIHWLVELLRFAPTKPAPLLHSQMIYNVGKYTKLFSSAVYKVLNMKGITSASSSSSPF